MGFTTVPPVYAGIFNQLSYVYKITDAATFRTDKTNIGFRSLVKFEVGQTVVIGGDSVRSEYKGSFIVQSVNVGSAVVPPFPSPRTVYDVYINTPNVGSSPSGVAAPGGKKPFYLVTGNQATIPSTVSVKDTIYASPNPQTLEYRFSIHGFLKKYYKLALPVIGLDPNLSQRFFISTQSNFIAGPYHNGYYGFKNPTLEEIEDHAPLGEYPIAYQDLKGVPLPVIYSEIDETTKAVKNFVTANPDLPVTLPAVSMNFLAGNTYTITFQHSEDIASLNFSPALPAWITVLASDPDQVILQIKTFTVTDGDYDNVDYDNVDYMTFSVNALSGCYNFSIRDGATEIFDFSFCIGPIAGVQKVCKNNSINFAFLNEAGGYTTLILPCVWNKGVTFGGESLSVRSNGQKFRTEYKDVFDTYKVSAQVLSRRTLDVLRKMYLSIHVLIWNDTTGAYDIPIVLAKQNLTGYGNKFTAPKQSIELTFDVSQELRTATA
jgi:hypothetical protein